MEFNKMIADMVVGDKVEGFYALKDAALKTSVAGKPFFSGVIADRTGSMDVKVWDYSGPVGSEPSHVGQVVKVRGEVTEFKGSLQMNVARIRLAEPTDQYDLSNLVPVAPIDLDAAFAGVEAAVASLEDEDYRRVAALMLSRHRDTFRTIPAAKSVHHSFISGLLMHTANMVRIADFLASVYPDIIDRSLLITGTLLHDFAKETEFAFSELGLVTDYSMKGQLLGHLVMGAQEVSQVCSDLGIPQEKSVMLQHMILSHHGEPDFGAAVRPMFAEAELLSNIDLIDSRMEIYSETLPGIPAGTFSSRIFSLDKKIYHHF